MSQRRRATLELILSVVLAACAVWAWFSAQSVVTVAPIRHHEFQHARVKIDHLVYISDKHAHMTERKFGPPTHLTDLRLA